MYDVEADRIGITPALGKMFATVSGQASRVV